MSEGVLSFLNIGWLTIFFAFVTGVWAFLIMGIIAAINAWFGIDLLARWKKRNGA